MNRYFKQGFIDKCAEYGVNPSLLIKSSSKLDRLVQAGRVNYRDMLKLMKPHEYSGLSGMSTEDLADHYLRYMNKDLYPRTKLKLDVHGVPDVKRIKDDFMHLRGFRSMMKDPDPIQLGQKGPSRLPEILELYKKYKGRLGSELSRYTGA